jgi:CDP-diacylglycerol--serine O-phosphatidyltransferase
MTMPAVPPARRPRPNLRKLMFVLPNLFTVSSIFCGVYSILIASEEGSGANFYKAAIAIFFGNFFDTFDGRVARLTKTQSEFGVELDSLADVITFGVAPAILVYKWALAGLGTTGLVICGWYAACGAIRLARFNVLTHAEHEKSPAGVSSFFVGLPIPLAAGMLVSLVLAVHRPGAEGVVPVAVLVVVLSFLMVSTVRYRTFKDVKLGAGMFAAFAAVLVIFLFFAATGRARQVFLVYFSIYLLLGLAEEVLFGHRRRAAARTALAAAGHPGTLPGAHASSFGGALPDESDGDSDGDPEDDDLLPAEEDDDVPLPGAPGDKP